MDMLGARLRTPSPERPLQVAQEKTITRQEALNRVGKFLDEGRKSLLPPNAKVWMTTWAQLSGQERIQRWLEHAQEDLQQYKWTDKITVPAPPRWSSTGPAETLVADLEELSKVTNWTATTQRKLVALASQFKHYTCCFEPWVRTQAKTEAMDNIRGF
ncbi:hypothetical protein V8C35DRAFT_282578 [Trichoderma chlorosporum]